MNIATLLEEHGDPCRVIIRTDGTIVPFEGKAGVMTDVVRITGPGSVDTVILADRHHVMLVNDIGVPLNLPANAVATRLYWERCRPGTTHQIRGDVVVVHDDEFAS